MGEDKGLMILEDKPLIIHLLETIEDLVDEIIMVFRDQNQINSYQKLINDHQIHLKDHDPQIQLVTDLVKDQGPLVGILTGLSYAKAEGSLVLPCDSPFISGYFINKIFKMVKNDKKSEFLAFVPTWPDESVEPLHAYYLKECMPAIEKNLDMGLRDVKSLFKLINVDYVGVEVLDPEKNSFHNLNRPEDL